MDLHLNTSLALDRSARRIDADGHLHVEMTNISKSNICGYYGREIPNGAALGLDPDRIYQLYRDPAELAAAAPSFAGKPLLMHHIPVTADEPATELVVGSIGTDVCFEAPFLRAPLSVWRADAIEAINSGEQRELSAGYRYRADMTPGVTPDGLTYDGVMRDIKANHVAIVSEGRAGPDVLRLGPGGNAGCQHYSAISVVSQVHRAQCEKAAEKQAGAKRQHQRQRHFGRDQRSAYRLARASTQNAPRAALLQCAV